MSDNSSDRELDSAGLLAEIRQTLLSTKPEEWNEFGEPFAEDKRLASAVERIEHLYTLPIPAGMLVLRSSLPVDCVFTSGKYAVRPSAPILYTIELRASNWDGRVLVDSKRRAASAGNQKVDVLAEGKVAEGIFNETGRRVSEYRRVRLAEFEVATKSLLESLESDIKSEGFSIWKKAVENKGTLVWYRAELRGLKVALGRQAKEGMNSYRMVIASPEGFTKNIDGQMANRFFVKIDEASQHAGLKTLHSILSQDKTLGEK